MQELPGPAFERYLAEVDRTHPPRPRFQPGPIRWWHWLPTLAMLGGAFALAAWRLFPSA